MLIRGEHFLFCDFEDLSKEWGTSNSYDSFNWNMSLILFFYWYELLYFLKNSESGLMMEESKLRDRDVIPPASVMKQLAVAIE